MYMVSFIFTTGWPYLSTYPKNQMDIDGISGTDGIPMGSVLHETGGISWTCRVDGELG